MSDAQGYAIHRFHGVDLTRQHSTLYWEVHLKVS
jgi:hypothetical protein